LKKPSISASIELKVEAPVNPSEDPEKIIDAVDTIIKGCSPEFRYGSRVVGRATGIEPLSLIYNQVRSRSVMGVLRRRLVDNRAGDSTWFLLNKQAAAAGIAALIDEEEESPLGPIRVTVSCAELDVLVDWLVPRT